MRLPEYLRVGHMSALLAWPIAIVAVTAFSLILAFSDPSSAEPATTTTPTPTASATATPLPGGTPVATPQPTVQPPAPPASTMPPSFASKAIFWTLLGVPVLVLPFMAYRRQRRVWVWIIGGIILFVIGVRQPFLQPLTALVAITLAEPPVKPDPPEVLEAQDRPWLPALARVRSKALSVHAELEPLAEREDLTGITSLLPELEAIGEEMDDVRPVTSPRATQARLHIATGIRQLLETTRRANAVIEFLEQYPELKEETARGKNARKLRDELDLIRRMVGNAGRQLLNTEGLLEALGIESDRPKATEEPREPEEPEAPLELAAPEEPEQHARPVPPTGPMPPPVPEIAVPELAIPEPEEKGRMRRPFRPQPPRRRKRPRF